MMATKVVVPFLRTPYNYDMMEASNASGLDCQDPSRTVQDQKEDADINTIVRRFGLGIPLPQNVRVPQYGDFEGVTSYQEALNQVIAADEAFMALPASIRSRFHNDAAAFVDFVGNEANRDEAERIGLIVSRKAQEGLSVSVVGEPGSPKVKAPKGPEGGEGTPAATP